VGIHDGSSNLFDKARVVRHSKGLEQAERGSSELSDCILFSQGELHERLLRSAGARHIQLPFLNVVSSILLTDT
jgi:hypothetical protein